MMKFENYYKVRREERFIDTPEEIGGRFTDIAGIAGSLEEAIKNMFGINKVPEELADLIPELRDKLEEAETLIWNTIETVSSWQLRNVTNTPTL